MLRSRIHGAAMFASLALLATGCDQPPTQPNFTDVSAALDARGGGGGGGGGGKPGGDAPSASTVINFRDAATDNILSDGNTSYEDGNCGVLADFSLNDARLDPDANFKGKTAKTCGTPRTLVFVWDTPADGGATKATREDGIFMNIDGVETETGTDVLHMGQFNVCNRLVFNPDEFSGSDALLVTSNADGTWTVRTQPAPHDKGYCVGDGRLWHMPFELTIRRK